MNEAAIPNRALQDFRPLIGQWSTTGTHPYVPDTVFHGMASFEWIEGGAFLIMHTEIDEPQIPSGIAVFGSDDAAGKYYMLYFDERGVSRKYDVEVGSNVITWSRNTPEFSQRFIIEILDGGEKLVGTGRMSRNGGAWEPDLQLTYTRVQKPPSDGSATA